MWAEESAADDDVDAMVSFRGDTDDFVQFLRAATALISSAKLDHEEDGLRPQLIRVQEAIKEPVFACVWVCVSSCPLGVLMGHVRLLALAI